MSRRCTKPFYSTALGLSAPLIVLGLNQLLMLCYGTQFVSTQPVDKLFHVVGGASIAISAAGLVWHLTKRKLFVIQDSWTCKILIVGSVSFSVVAWEIFEYIFIFPIYPMTLGYVDTITDMSLGLAGGAVLTVLISSPNYSGDEKPDLI